jgi:hypothetical protein
MANYHLNVKIISRGKGQSAIAAAAYRSGERLRDEQADQQKFYRSRAERIQSTEIMAPKDAPEWVWDRGQLWNHAERAENRKDAQLAREFEISLPHEMTQEQREWLAKDFAREQFVRKGYVVDMAFHAPDKDGDQRNFHVHMMVTMRPLGDGPEGFARTLDRSLNSNEQLGVWREQWAHLANRHLERHGYEERIDHRSHKARGIDREPTIHLGYAANEMAARGAQSDRMDELRAILSRNEIRLNLKELEAELRGLEKEQALRNIPDRDHPEPGRQRRGAHVEGEPGWTDRAGMVAQQRSANKWAKEIERGSHTGTPAGGKNKWAEEIERNQPSPGAPAGEKNKWAQEIERNAAKGAPTGRTNKWADGRKPRSKEEGREGPGERSDKDIERDR